MPSASVSTKADTKNLAAEVYDLLMGRIEPELLLASIPTLDAKYADETATEHEARMERYAEAYGLYDQAFAAFIADVDQKVRAGHRDALKSKEEASRNEEQTTLDSLLSAFN